MNKLKKIRSFSFKFENGVGLDLYKIRKKTLEFTFKDIISYKVYTDSPLKDTLKIKNPIPTTIIIFVNHKCKNKEVKEFIQCSYEFSLRHCYTDENAGYNRINIYINGIWYDYINLYELYSSYFPVIYVIGVVYI